jgi:sortase A
MGFVRFLGKLLISVGFGVLLFVAWTLWGTGIITARHQQALEQAWAHEPPIVLEEGKEVRVPESFQPGPGEPAFRLRIPALKFQKMVVEGVDTEDLYKGPGHYPSCRSGFERPLCTEFEEMWPGENGRVIVSGHRTTYGAPFFDLDKLRPGDEIITETRWGDFTYEVTKLDIVDDSSLAIAIQNDSPEIVLTTCNPKFSAEQRLIVYATLVS